MAPVTCGHPRFPRPVTIPISTGRAPNESDVDGGRHTTDRRTWRHRLRPDPRSPRPRARKPPRRSRRPSARPSLAASMTRPPSPIRQRPGLPALSWRVMSAPNICCRCCRLGKRVDFRVSWSREWRSNGPASTTPWTTSSGRGEATPTPELNLWSRRYCAPAPLLVHPGGYHSAKGTATLGAS